MSIFKDTLKQDIQDQLKARQEALIERTPKAIQYYNSRNAWIRMSSAVDVNDDKGALAKKHILQGGILSEKGTLRSGIGTTNDSSYSTTSPGGATNRLGIRPMPGITSIEVKSKSAYGSLREVTVNFIAWDIRQLEDLELLYMRPGYTVLVEWGWMPYLDNSKELISNITPYDIIDTPRTKDAIFKDLYKEAVEIYKGNYDAMYGYVKNYSWSARADGGYDCTTSIISLGEILESLKVNYAPFNNLDNIEKTGLIISGVEGVSVPDDIKQIYSKNVLAGLFYELFTIGQQKMDIGDEGDNYKVIDKVKGGYYDLFGQKLNIIGGEGESRSTGKIGASDNQIYITLEGLCNVINNYVTFVDSNSKTAYIKCSVLDREYLASGAAPSPLTGDGYLLSLAHPLQLSVDPTVCIIKSTVWADGFKIDPEKITSAASTGANAVTFPSKLSDADLGNLLDQIYYISIPTKTIKNKQAIVNYIKQKTQQDPNTVKALTKLHYERLQDANYILTRPTGNIDLVSDAINEGDNINKNKLNKSLKALGVPPFISLYNFLIDDFRYTNIDSEDVDEAFGSAVSFAKSNPVTVQQEELDEQKKKLEETQTTAIENLQYLKNIKRPYFYKDDWETELGIIGNIYVNLNYLFRLALDNNLESLDTKEKKDINLYNFLKSVLSEISAATGNVNNFDLFVDPIKGDTVYIIDVNYVDTKSRKEAYDTMFKLEMHNLQSTVRSYKLESQIFPDQSTIVAIGAQVGGGALATDNNTMLDFNKGLTDRVIPKKIDPTTDPNISDPDRVRNQLQNLNSALQSLYDFFGDLEYGWILDGKFDADKSSDYKNSLKDLINFYKNLTNSDIKNRAIIPTKLSITMDGIGGLVIGHLFKIDEDLLPKGYKGGLLGSKNGYTITSIGHSINGNDWTTTIEAQTIILDDPLGDPFNIESIKQTAEKTINKPSDILAGYIDAGKRAISGVSTGGASKIICNQVRKNGEVDDLLVSIKPYLYNRHYSPVNQSDNTRIRLQPNAMRDLEAMLIAAFNEGILLKVNSAYRTYADQVRIKQDSQKSGLPAATAGTSNHGFGLAVDLADKNGTRINITGRSGNKIVPKTLKEWEWLQKNQATYGFKNLNPDNESHHYDYQKPGINCPL